MTTPTMDRHTLLDLYGHGMPDERPPAGNPKPKLIWAAPKTQRASATNIDHPTIALARKYFHEISEMDSDQRLDYILSVNPAVTEEHLGQLVLTVESWLSDEARIRIRTAAREDVRHQRSPHQVLPHWLTDQEFERFQRALRQTEFPDHIIATCYAVCQADEVAHAAYFIQQDRMYPQVNFGKIEQTPEEIEADLRFAKAK